MIRFGKYTLLDRVAAGGMAEVYRAKMFGASGFSKYFAVKRILPDLNEEQEFIDMFIDEAKILVNLSHPNLVQVFELGQVGKMYYIAMEFISGRSLAALARRLKSAERRLPLTASLYVGLQMARGLGYAHACKDPNGVPLGIVHRDISPQNVLVSWTGDVRIVDFGVAKAANKLTSSRAGQLKGKFSYMSPEQAAGQEVDHRSDIFAAGVVLWEMVANRRLFKADSETATLKMVERCEVPPIEEVAAPVPPGLPEVLRRALAREVVDRYRDAREMARDLAACLHGLQADYTSEELGQVVHELFDKEIAEEAELLRGYAETVAHPLGGTTPELQRARTMMVPGRGRSSSDPPSAPSWAGPTAEARPAGAGAVAPAGTAAPPGGERTAASTAGGFEVLTSSFDTDPGGTPPPAVVLARGEGAPAEIISTATGVGELGRRSREDSVSLLVRPRGLRAWHVALAAIFLLAAGAGAFFAVGGVVPFWDAPVEDGPSARSLDDPDERADEDRTGAGAKGAGDPRARGPAPAGDEAAAGGGAGPGGTTAPPDERPETGAIAPASAAPPSPGSAEASVSAASAGAAPPAAGGKRPRSKGGDRRSAVAAPPAAYGFLEVGSKPWAEVYVNGAPTGRSTPAKGLRVPAGAVTIELVHPPTGARKTIRLDVAAGETRRVFEKLE